MKKIRKKLMIVMCAFMMVLGVAVSVQAAPDAVEDYAIYGMRVIQGAQAEIGFYFDYDGYIKARASLYIYDEDANLIDSLEKDPLEYNGYDVEWYGYTMKTDNLSPGVYIAVIDVEYHNSSKWVSATEDYLYFAFEVVNENSSLNGIAVGVDGTYRYYKNGRVDTSYTGFDDRTGYLYVRNGVVDENFCGPVKDHSDGLIKYVSYGEWDNTYEGIVTYDNVTYYLSDGAIDYSYEGIYMPEGTTAEYYVYNGIAGEACPVTHKWHQMQGAICADCGKTKFTDVQEGAFYFAPVGWAVMNNITQGTSANTFSPDDGCTRAQVVTFLWRAEGCPKPVSSENPFKDVESGQWYTDAVLWAVEKGITTGMTAATFEPFTTCNRAQIATFMYRAAGSPAVSGSVTNPFMDVESGQWYTNAILWAVEKGITNGVTPTAFMPFDDCTRGQIVTFLYRNYK